jgi:hypothetical protein
MKKKIVLIILTITLIFILTGCATVTYSTINGADGSLTYEIRITIDEDYANKDLALQAAEETARQYYQENQYRTITVDKEKYEVILKEYYPSLTDYYIANNITGNEVEEDTGSETKKGLYTYYTRSSTTSFDDENIDSIANIVNQTYFQGHGDISDVKMQYKYGTIYSSVTSDADSVDEVDGVYVHTFNINPEGRDRVINLTSKSPRAELWYALCIGLALIIGAIIFAYFKISNKPIKPQSVDNQNVFNEFKN